MNYRKTIETTEELARWYDQKYREMKGTWVTPPEDCNKHLDDAGVTVGDWLILDIGAGGGHFLAEATKRGYAIGLEVSDVARDYADKFTVAPVIKQSIECARVLECDSFDYVFSNGSLEHVINLDAALEEVRRLLKPTGTWYAYLPTLDWKHEDQPNERTASPEEWKALFASHKLITDHEKLWNDNVAIWGHKE